MNSTNHTSENKRFLKHILITLIAGALTHFLNYLFSIYLARKLDVTYFNYYNAILGIVTLIQIPAIAIQTTITKKVAEKKDFDLKDFKKKSTIQLTLIAAVISIIFFAFGKQISNIANIPVQYIPALTLVVFTAIINPIAKGFLLGLEKITQFNTVMIAETLFKFAIGYFALQTSSQITTITLAFAVPFLISTLIILPFTNTKSKKKPEQELKLNYKQIFLIFITFFMLNIPFTLDLILVNPAVRASYGALSLIGKIVYFGAVTIANLMISRLANTQGQSRKKNLLISLGISALIGIVICIIYWLFTEQIVNIVFGGLYKEITRYVVPYSIAMIGYAISYMVITSELVNDSYIHIYLLLFTSLLQGVLYKINNNSLYDAFLNQIIIYGVLFFFVLILLIFKTLKTNGKEKTKEEQI